VKHTLCWSGSIIPLFFGNIYSVGTIFITSVTTNIFKHKENSTEHFIIFSMITNIYNKKTKGPTLMELFTATGKLKKFLFDN